MSNVVDILQRARDLYAEAPSHVSVRDIPAEGTYCVLTALTEVVPDCAFSLEKNLAQDVLYKALDKIDNNRSLVSYNAEHSTEEVVQLFNSAIELATDGKEPND